MPINIPKSYFVKFKYVDNAIVLNNESKNIARLESFTNHVNALLADNSQNEKIGVIFKLIERTQGQDIIHDASINFDIYKDQNDTHLLNGEDISKLAQDYTDYIATLANKNANTIIELTYYYYHIDPDNLTENTNYFENNTNFINFESLNISNLKEGLFYPSSQENGLFNQANNRHNFNNF